jgi:geranylgeranyl diphosphate synthase type II
MTVQEELDAFLDTGESVAQRHGEDALDLWCALRAATAEGKRFRPALLLATYRAYAGAPDRVVHRVAAAVELLHTALLVHDDVIDGDVIRRGEPNVSGTYTRLAAERGADVEGERTLGVAAGILAGDLALVGATKAIALCGAPPVTTGRLLELLERAVQITCVGELTDVLACVLPGRDTTLVEAITMEEQKTAVYSFQLPMQLGAVLAGADDDVVHALGEVGRLAGIGFQLIDDLQGVFGDSERTGKTTVGDLREGKMTPLMTHARSTTAWPQIAPHVGDRALGASGAATVRALLEECGSRDFVERLADDYVGAALRLAEQLGLGTTLLDELATLSRRLLDRAA